MGIEAFLEGEEASLFALVDGARCVVLASAQDHKRVGEGDTGPNTGGMGAYSPAPILTPELEARAMREIVEPTARAMAAAGTPFSGVLFAGLMLTSNGPSLIEYNVRFGDPECEAIMARITGDFAALLHAVATGAAFAAPPLVPDTAMTGDRRCHRLPRRTATRRAVTGIDAAEAVDGVTVFNAGTAATATTHGRPGGVGGHRASARIMRRPRPRLSKRSMRSIFRRFHRRDIGWRRTERMPMKRNSALARTGCDACRYFLVARPGRCGGAVRGDRRANNAHHPRPL